MQGRTETTVSYGMFMLMCSLEVKHHITTNAQPDSFNVKDVSTMKLMTSEDVEHLLGYLSQ